MKNIRYFSLIVTLILTALMPSATFAAAQAPTNEPAGETTSNKLDSQISNLKEKIASRVSELNLVEKRGIIGTVEEVSGNQITIIDIENKKRFIDVDELTKFTSSGAGAFGLSDIKKGTKISALGLYNKQSRHLLARFIRLSIDPTIITGAIAAIDKKNFVITIKTPENKEQKIDVSTITKIYEYSAEDLVKAGFSKLTVGQRIIAIGFPDKTDPSLIVTSRLTFFPELPAHPGISLETETSSPAAN
ncbi:MAG: hypothetical protein AAB553_03425 [Patescibacteria group bacterium]